MVADCIFANVWIFEQGWESTVARHLPGKVARLISDFLTICDLARLIEHEMEKRMVARHGLVKLDALLNLLAQLKNDIRRALAPRDRRMIGPLEVLVSRLRNDLRRSVFEMGRDTMAAHALRLDLMRIVDAWKGMGEATFGVFESDLQEIDVELRGLSAAYPTALTYPGASAATVDSTWPVAWSLDTHLGDPKRPRYATVYPALATAGIVAPLPGGPPVQDVVIRAVGLATFIRQTGILLQPVGRGTEVERLFAEIMLNDYCALWELLFASSIQNEYGQNELCVLDHWINDGWDGARCLTALKQAPHPHFDKWRQDVRNKTTAHVAAETDIWSSDLTNWPMTIDELFNEALRVIEHTITCARMDVRSSFLFIPPTPLRGENITLSRQEGRRWKDG